MTVVSHLHDPISGFAYQNPLSLPCGHTVDISTATRTSECPFDRTPFDHVNLRTNYSIKDGLDLFRKQPTTQKITFFFQNFQLRYVLSASLTKNEWQCAEATYAWMYKNLPQNYQTLLNTFCVIQGILEWNSRANAYVYTLVSENHDFELTKLFELTISENWAKNFSGKYFDSLKSKNLEKNK